MYSCSPTKTDELDQFFPTESINKQPTFMRCHVPRDNLNNPIYERNKPFTVNTNGKEGCVEIIHPNNTNLNLQNGFGKNIDIDSELKRINRYADKCYQNNYKLDPLGRDAQLMKSPLVCHDNIFKINQTQSYKKSEQNSLLDRNDMPSRCVNFQKFSSCKNTPMASKHIEMYDFGQSNYCTQYPCQKVWNNVTKRSMSGNHQTPQDLNKRNTKIDYSKYKNTHPNLDQFYSEDLMCMPYSITTEFGSTSGDCKSTPVALRYY